MTCLEEVAIARIEKAVQVMEAFQRAGWHADVIPCWDGVPILEIKKRKPIEKEKRQ